MKFAVNLLAEKYVEKRKKLHVAFMDLKAAYDRVNRMALWVVLRIYEWEVSSFWKQ